MKKLFLATMVIVLVAATIATTAYAGKPNDCWMTGGGSVFNTNGHEVLYAGRRTHGFVLHCDPRNSDNLQINWDGNRFHLTELVSAVCPNDPAIDPDPPGAYFDTFIGMGEGRYNGRRGFCAAWTFTDAGEPGIADTADIVITNCTTNEVMLQVSGPLTFGNHQAHSN